MNNDILIKEITDEICNNSKYIDRLEKQVDTMKIQMDKIRLEINHIIHNNLELGKELNKLK